MRNWTSIDYYPGFKQTNKRLLLNQIRYTPGGISRAELARRMGLTRSAVTSIVNNLLHINLVRETESGPATGGRRPIMLEINPRRGYVAGIDLGVTHMRLIVNDLAANVKQEIEIPFDIEIGPQACLQAIHTHFLELLNNLHLSTKDILAAGIGVPGPVVAEAGTVRFPPIMPGWDNYPIRDHLQTLWGCPVSVNNDAELGALGEWAYGAGRGEQHLVYIKVGSGIGAGLLLQGQIYRGASGCAGEIGHITVLTTGPRCTCGNQGCLEAVASGKAIALQARAAMRAGKRSLLSGAPVEEITAHDIAAAARLGDLLSQQILIEAGGYLGIAIAGLVNLVNPTVIVVGGGLAQTGDLLLEPIRQAVRERSLRSAAECVRIIAAVLGRRSTSMGAVAQALNIAFSRLSEI